MDFILSGCIVPAFYALPFLFILKRMCSFQELERITTVICLSILLLSIAFIALVLMNPSVLLSGTGRNADQLAGTKWPSCATLILDPITIRLEQYTFVLYPCCSIELLRAALSGSHPWVYRSWQFF